MSATTERPTLSDTEAAKLLGVGRHTIARMVREGHIAIVPGAHRRRVLREPLMRMLRGELITAVAPQLAAA